MKFIQKAFFVVGAVCLGTLQVFSQIAGKTENLPTDYLSKEFHAGRRQALRDLMPANSVTAIFSYPDQVCIFDNASFPELK